MNQYESEFQIKGSTIQYLQIKNSFITFDGISDLKRQMKVSHVVTNTGRLDDQRHMGTLTLCVDVGIIHGDNEYRISLGVGGCFVAPAEMDEAEFHKMMEINGVTSLYSIARGFIQSTSSQTLMGGSILLPMFNVAKYHADLKKNKQQKDKK